MPFSPSPIRHVIIGNSAAALSAISAIRQNDSTSSITLISAEKCFAYSPVLLTYYMAGRISRQQVFLTDDTYYRQNNVSLKLGDPAAAIDVCQRSITLTSGEMIDYDRLLIATGSSRQTTGCYRGRPARCLYHQDPERCRSYFTPQHPSKADCNHRRRADRPSGSQCARFQRARNQLNDRFRPAPFAKRRWGLQPFYHRLH